VVDDASWAVLRRLTGWLDQFKSCFGHRAQRISLREYVDGLLGDSPRKSMQAMLARVTERRSYQAFQHFVTDAPWSAQAVWRRLLAVLPDRAGVLILDDTPFLKQGSHSVGVDRQYATTQKRVTNCQVAVTAALWTGVRAWLVGAELYLPQAWLTPARRTEARIPATVPFQEKWRLALTLVRRVRAAGLAIGCVLADAAYGDIAALRTALTRLHVPYVMAVASDTTVFRGVPRVHPPRRRGGPGRPPVRPQLPPRTRRWAIAALIASLPARQWHRVTWRNGTNRRWQAQFVALRVTPVVDWRNRRVVQDVWLLAERGMTAATPHRYYFSNLPVTASVTQLARLAHQRWAIEQQYQDLKSDLGLDHFEGRTYPGWHHHVVLSAVAYGFLQAERSRRGAPPRVTFSQVHAITQEVFTGLVFITRNRYWRWLQRGHREWQHLALRC
jgi:SRSO17 transposase